MTATGLERKVRQLDNDVSEIYTMIFDIQGTQKRHSNRFDELQTDITGLGAQMTGLEGRMGSLEGQMAGLERRMGSLEGKVDSVAAQLDEVISLLRS